MVANDSSVITVVQNILAEKSRDKVQADRAVAEKLSGQRGYRARQKTLVTQQEDEMVQKYLYLILVLVKPYINMKSTDAMQQLLVYPEWIIVNRHVC